MRFTRQDICRAIGWWALGVIIAAVIAVSAAAVAGVSVLDIAHTFSTLVH